MNNNFIPQGDNNKDQSRAFPSRALYFILFLLFMSGGFVYILPLLIIGAIFYMFFASKKKANAQNQTSDRPAPRPIPHQNSASPEDYDRKEPHAPVARKNTSSPESYDRRESHTPKPYVRQEASSPESYERSDVPTAASAKQLQRVKEQHSHTGSTGFDSYSGTFATSTVKRCKCRKCGFVTDTSHRFCGRCDADLELR